MARIIRMPSEEELPDGPRRRFVTELRRYYRAAGRPPLRRISDAIENRNVDFNEITASQETVRRILRGTVVPHDWDRVNALLQVLCEMGGIDPNAEEAYDGYGERETIREYIKRLWDAALEEEPDAPPVPAPTPPPVQPAQGGFGAAASDPWGTGGGGFSDDPPF